MLKKAIMKRVKGPNAKAYNKSKSNVYITEPKCCKHEVTPGDKLTCNCCGKLVFNIYQHQTTQCELSQYYLMLQDKFREAYLFLLQRHKEFLDVWEHPEQFVMMNSKLTKRMMEKFSFEKLQLQVASWNVLLPVQTGDVIDGKRHVRSMFGCYFADVLADMGGPKKFHWEVETGSKDKIVTKWELNHEPHESKHVGRTMSRRRWKNITRDLFMTWVRSCSSLCLALERQP